MSGKEIVIEWIRELPDSSTVEDVVEVLALRSELRLAKEDVDAGRLVSQEQMKRESAAWSSP